MEVGSTQPTSKGGRLVAATTLLRLLTVSALYIAVTIPLAAAPRLKDPREPQMEGSWRMSSGEFDGKDLMEANRGSRTHWVITDTTITIYTAGAEYRGHWTYRVAPAARPAEIDLTTRVDGPPVTYPCVYSLEDGKLTVCIQNFADRGRPKAFEAKPDSGVAKYVFVRAKPGDEKGRDPDPVPK
ncbi:MAG TPA: TIGR03067 domain-containing protein [Gemmataceae bacterium]|nr:TIGR03067 domain-containing protein [Gemmataceae bacterium]